MKITIIGIYHEDYEWLQAFKNLHKIQFDSDAVAKLIEIHKAWNRKLSDDELSLCPACSAMTQNSTVEKGVSICEDCGKNLCKKHGDRNKHICDDSIKGCHGTLSHMG